MAASTRRWPRCSSILRCLAVDAGGERPGGLARRGPRADDGGARIVVQAGDHPDPGPGPDRDGRTDPGAGPVPGRASAVRVPARSCRAAPEQGARGVGTAGTPPLRAPTRSPAPVVTWMFGQRLAGHSAARITRALNDAWVPCPSAADPGRNPHRAGSGWTLRTVAAILANPRYTGGRCGTGAVPGGPGRPGQHRAGAQAGAAVEPARGLGHLETFRAHGAGQRS